MTDEQLKQIEDLAIKLKELNDVDMVEALLKDNQNEFVHNDKCYRIHKPTPAEKEIANKERMKRYFDMVKDPAYMFRKDLMKIYKDRNIDIEGMDHQIKVLYANEQKMMARLAQTQDPADINLYKVEILNLRTQQAELHIQKDDLLRYCIEQKLEDFLRCYLLSMVLEVKDGELWKKVYSNYDEFMNSTDEQLQAKAAQVFAVMLFHENI